MLLLLPSGPSREGNARRKEEEEEEQPQQARGVAGAAWPQKIPSWLRSTGTDRRSPLSRGQGCDEGEEELRTSGKRGERKRKRKRTWKRKRKRTWKRKRKRKRGASDSASSLRSVGRCS